MPTSERPRLAAATLALLALAACDPAFLAGGPTRTAVTVAGRSVSVAAPPGFCIDAESTSVDSTGAFVLLTDCGLLGVPSRAGAAPGGGAGAALTASISAGGLAGEGDDPAQSLAELEAFVATEDGRTLLGRSGRPDRIRVLATQTRDGVLYVLVEDRGPQPIAGVDGRFWRAFMEVKGRMAVLSVLGFEGASPGPQEGLNQLAAFADAIQRANGA